MTASNVVPLAGRPVPSTRPDSAYLDVHPELGISLMDHLYNRLDGAYPGRWRKDFPDPQSIENWRESWAEAFEEEGITPEEMMVGLQQARKRYAWPPSVAEFIQAARPPLNVDAAYHEAMAGLAERQAGRMGTWSHRAVYWAAQAMVHDLMNLTPEQVKARWKKLLSEHMARKGLPDVPAPALQLPAPGRSATESAAARRQLAMLQADAVIKQPGTGKAIGWARAILKRAAAGDPSLTMFTVAAARDALARLTTADDDTNDNDDEKGSNA